MKELSLHILDIVQNSIRAEADRIGISIVEDTAADRFTLSVEDNGKGMTVEQVTKAIDPFFTTRTTRRVGLGLSLLKAATERCTGEFKVTSTPGRGTKVTAVFQRSHWDRAPLGDMAATMITLVASNPELDFSYSHRVDEREYSFDTAEVRKVLGDVPLNDPSVLAVLRKDIAEGLAELQTKDALPKR